MHTPGPWNAVLPKDLFPHVEIGVALPYPDKSGMHRPTITINNGSDPEAAENGASVGARMETHRANARLIAAAPDLLIALKMVLRAVDWDAEKPADSYGIKAYDVAMKAIAKSAP